MKNTEILIYTKTLLAWCSTTNCTSNNSSMTVNTSQNLPKLYMLQTFRFKFIFTWETSRIFWFVYLKLSTCYIKSVHFVYSNWKSSNGRSQSKIKCSRPLKTDFAQRKKTRHKMWTFRFETAINLLQVPAMGWALCGPFEFCDKVEWFRN